MDIISASKTPKYKLLKWLLVGVGALVLIIGFVFNALSKNIQATAITFDTGGQIEKNPDNRWRMNVWTLETSLTVNTIPNNSTKTPITFEVTGNLDNTYGNTFIEPINPILSGRPAEIKLKADGNGNYAFNKKVTIIVSCGIVTEILEITILPPSEQIDVRISVKEGEKTLQNKNGVFEINANTYETMLSSSSQGKWISGYRLEVGLYIYDIPHSPDSDWREECTDDDDVGVSLKLREDYNMDGITLLGAGYGLLIDYEYLQTGASYNFRVSCTYLGIEYFELITILIV